VEVKVDASDILKRLDKLNDAIGKQGMQQLGTTVRRLVKSESLASFSRHADPNSGRAWKPRKNPDKGSLMNRSGGLRRSIFAKYSIEADGVSIEAGVKDSRSGNRSYHAVAGVHHYGRKDQRQRIIGRGSGTGRGGPMPKRRFIGLSIGSRKKVVEEGQRLIRRTA
jgi:phage gpG-like protein